MSANPGFRATIAKKLFVDGKQHYQYTVEIRGLMGYRLAKAETIYEDSGCSSIARYGKCTY